MKFGHGTANSALSYLLDLLLFSRSRRLGPVAECRYRDPTVFGDVGKAVASTRSDHLTGGPGDGPMAKHLMSARHQPGRSAGPSEGLNPTLLGHSASLSEWLFLLRVFGRLPVTDMRRARGQASEKPQGRKPRGEFAPAVVSVYGDLAPM